ncbi:MAG: hypothetical protein IPK97_10995 [Ahniella sp.]|nr:hypothetical protein [Ahniella sp.]
MLILSTSMVWAADHEILRANGSGHLVIDPNGAVSELQFDQSFGKEIDPILRDRVQAWRFEPITKEGKPVNAKAHFQLTLQADFGDKSTGELRIVRADFVDPPVEGKVESRTVVVPPRYPVEALKARLGAELIVLVKIDETGKVVELSGQNSWLNGRKGSLSATRQDAAMKAFIEATDKAVSQWQFPELAAQGKHFAEVPVLFTIGRPTVWRQSYPVQFAKEPWTAEIEAGKLGSVNSDGSSTNAEFRLLDRLDAEG